MKKFGSTLGLGILLLGLGAVLVPTAGAETQWQKDHPRRVEVNGRLAKQNARIHQERKAGELTGAQAAELHQEDRQIGREEHLMAKQDNGHITKPDMNALNQQENAVSQQIGH